LACLSWQQIFFLNVYCRNPEDIARHFSSLESVEVLKKKLTPSNVLYMRLKDVEETELEASPFFKKIKPIEKEFWRVDAEPLL